MWWARDHGRKQPDAHLGAGKIITFKKGGGKKRVESVEYPPAPCFHMDTRHSSLYPDSQSPLFLQAPARQQGLQHAWSLTKKRMVPGVEQAFCKWVPRTSTTLASCRNWSAVAGKALGWDDQPRTGTLAPDSVTVHTSATTMARVSRQADVMTARGGPKTGRANLGTGKIGSLASKGRSLLLKMPEIPE